MVQERREPTLSGIKPERDEIMRHQSRSTGKGAGAQRPARPARPARRKVPASLFALILALAAGGGAGFSYWQLELTRQNLVAAQQRIGDLEARLDSSSGESAQSLTEINERLKTADSEIRKLWGVSYDTNRKAIQANKEGIAALVKLADEASSASKAAKTVADSQQATLDALQTLSNEQQLILAKLSEDLNIHQDDIDRLLTQTTKMDDRLRKLENELTKKVASNEEAIKAIDTFRRSVNSDILQLKQQLGPTP